MKRYPTITPGAAASLATVFFIIAAWRNPWNAITGNPQFLLGQFFGYFLWGWIFAGIYWLINRKKKTVNVTDFALKAASAFLVLGGIVQLGKLAEPSPIEELRTSVESRCFSGFKPAKNAPNYSVENLAQLCACYSSSWTDGLTSSQMRQVYANDSGAPWVEERTFTANNKCGAAPFLLALAVETTNADAPFMVDDRIRLDRVSADGRKFNYHYTVIDLVVDESNRDEIVNSMNAVSTHRDLAQFVCDNPDTKIWLDYDLDMVFTYADMNGSLVSKMTVSRADCD